MLTRKGRAIGVEEEKKVRMGIKKNAKNKKRRRRGKKRRERRGRGSQGGKRFIRVLRFTPPLQSARLPATRGEEVQGVSQCRNPGR